MAERRATLSPCALTDLGRMEYAFARGKLPDSQRSLLVVRLAGAASNASSEMGVFDYASAMIMAGLEAWTPKALILDFRQLEYKWGDEMLNVLYAAQRWYKPVQPLLSILEGDPEVFPVAVITSDANREGLLSLLTGYMHEDPSTWLYESLDDAVHALDDRLKGAALG